MSSMRIAHCVLLLIASLAAAPASAQKEKSHPDIPERARIRIEVLRADTLGRKSATLSGTGVVHRVDADSIAFRLDDDRELWIAPWARVQSLEVSEGTRNLTFGERAGFAASSTFLGTAIAYLSWHSCNDPEQEQTLSCIVFPRRLGTAVRGGTWLGLAVGLGAALSISKTEEWRRVNRPSAPRPFVELSARTGLMLGVSFQF